MALKSIKPRELHEHETFESYGKWQSLLQYTLSKDPDWKRFLPKGAEAKWKTEDTAHRGFIDDADGDNKMTQDEKVTHLHGMLQYIAHLVPDCLGHEIVEESESLKSVWGIIRRYYNFEQSEAQFLSLCQIKWAGLKEERPERLYRRIVSHVKDNLLTEDSPLKHNKLTVTKDEVMSATTERLLVIRWLETIDPRLPNLIKRVFATELLSNSLKDIQPQIANAMESLLQQLAAEDAQVSYLASHQLDDDTHIQASQVRFRGRGSSRGQHSRFTYRPGTQPRSHTQSSSRLNCSYCLGWNRNHWGHTMATCSYISEADKRAIAKKQTTTYRVTEEHDQDVDEGAYGGEDTEDAE